MHYGIRVFGQHFIIKLRVSISDNDRNVLRSIFGKSLHLTPTRKGYTLIEGCLPYQEFSAFRERLDIAMIDSKIAKLESKRANRLKENFWTTVSPDEADML